MLNTEEKILMNGRIVVLNTYFIPAMATCLIVSTIYLTSNATVLNILLGWGWIIMAIIAYFKFKKAKIEAIRMDN